MIPNSTRREIAEILTLKFHDIQTRSIEKFAKLTNLMHKNSAVFPIHCYCKKVFCLSSYHQRLNPQLIWECFRNAANFFEEDTMQRIAPFKVSVPQLCAFTGKKIKYNMPLYQKLFFSTPLLKIKTGKAFIFISEYKKVPAKNKD